MITYDLDPDVVRWGLHNLDVCTLSSTGSCSSVTQFATDTSAHGYVQEGYNEPVHTYEENDAVIAQALQEELSRVAEAEASGFSNPGQESIIVQDWHNPLARSYSSGHGNGPEATSDGSHNEGKDVSHKEGDCSTKKNDECESYNTDMSSSVYEDLWKSLNITDDSSELDGEVGKRLNQMVPVRHVPKINGELPTADEAISDHQRLLDRLQLYDLIEHKIQGDGNCQFRALSDQLYRSPEHHKVVRDLVVSQLQSQPEMYGGYVPMGYENYLKKMSKSGEWGDHVTLQAAADIYGVKIFVITSFKDTCYIEILPHIEKSERAVICLSFWAEVHYNSIYPEGEMPMVEGKKKKKWWSLGS